MRILYLIDNYSLGGAQTIVKGILENSSGNPDVFSIALRVKNPEMIIHNPNATVYKSRSRYSIFPLFFLKKFIRIHQIDLLHCQLPRSVIFGFLLKRLFFRDIVFIIHEQGDIFESWLYAAALKLVSAESKGLIACSNATGKKLQESAGIKSSKISVIYNFVDQNRFKPVSKEAEETNYIGFAGRIEKRKGWREFLQIAEGMRDKNNFKFLIAGTGAENNQIIRIINNNNLTNVEYLGYLSNMSDFYHRLRLLIIPSYFEPMGMVAVESMACGVPVIASDVPGLNELIDTEKTGWLVPAHSVKPVIRIIEEYCSQPIDYQQKISSQATRKAETYSYLHFTEKLQLYYKQLI